MVRKFMTTSIWSGDLAALVLRLVFCGLMIYNHAFLKLTIFGENPESFPDPIEIGGRTSFYLVIFAELICGGLVLVGLFTRIALLPLLVTMSVALFRVQWSNPLTEKELPLMYLAVFIALLLMGPGRWSLDYLFSRVRK